MLFTVSAGAGTKEPSDHHPFEAEQGHCWRSLICHYVMMRCVVKLYGFYISIVRPENAKYWRLGRSRIENVDDGRSSSFVLDNNLLDSKDNACHASAGGSNQIKWALQNVALSFLVLFALGCILIFPASDVSIVSQLLPFLQQAYNKQRGICLLDLTLSIKIAVII